MYTRLLTLIVYFITVLVNDILILTLRMIFSLLTLRIFLLLTLRLIFCTDLNAHISITDLDSDIFTTQMYHLFLLLTLSNIFTTTFFYYWPLEWYFWGGCPPEQPVACDWSPGTGPGSLHCLSDGSYTEIPWCCASSITPSTSRYKPYIIRVYIATCLVELHLHSDGSIVNQFCYKF